MKYFTDKHFQNVLLKNIQIDLYAVYFSFPLLHMGEEV